MRESRTYGFVRGAHSDMRPYRDTYLPPVRVVHQHVEMRQKIPPDNASKVEIGRLQRLEVVHHHGIVCNRV